MFLWGAFSKSMKTTRAIILICGVVFIISGAATLGVFGFTLWAMIGISLIVSGLYCLVISIRAPDSRIKILHSTFENHEL